MIGTAANALTASSFSGSGQPLPEGWTYLNEGAFRRAYLGPDSVVYKVENPWEKREQCNWIEAERWAQVGTSINHLGFRLAECWLYPEADDVLAMEYIPHALLGKAHEKSDACRKWARAVDLLDICSNNYLIHALTGDLVIVDYAT